MVKQSKLVYVIGSVVIGIVTIIAVVAALMLSGVIDASSRRLVFISGSEEIVYNGEALRCTDYEIESGELKSGHVAQVIMTGSQAEVGESDNTYAVAIYDQNGADVTADYEITTHYGKLKVLPIPLSATSASIVEEYNGNAVQKEEATLTAGKLIEGDTIEFFVTGTRTDAGESDNAFVGVVRNANGKDVTKNYVINYTYGTIEVLPMEVAIDSAERTITYDGEEHSFANDSWTYVNENKRPDTSLDVQIFFSGSIRGVGTAKKELASFVVKDGDRDVSFNYNFTFIGAEVEVLPLPIIVEAGSATKVYDGTALTNSDTPRVVDGELLEGHAITGFTVTGSQVGVGESENVLDPESIKITDAEGNDVTKNYDITVRDGKLTVTSATGNELEEKKDTDITQPGSEVNEQDLETVIAKVTANHDGAMYLRRESYQDYQSDSAWSAAPVYADLLDGTYSMNYLVGAGLKNRGITTLKRAEIEPINEMLGYVLPYYYATTQSDICEIQTSDTVNSGTLGSSYFANYYNINYTSLSSGHLEEYTEQEKAYYEFVKSKYLKNPSDEAYPEILAKIIVEGWDKSDSDIIEKVCEYVKGLADYDIKTDIEDKEDDIVSAMVKNKTTNYTALCRHYATTGVAVFRALEIPARYTVGYMINAKDGEEVDVKVGDGHAWVEVYLEGVGWVPVECTASSSSGSSSTNQTTYVVKPVDTIVAYQGGTIIEPKDEVKIELKGKNGKKWSEYEAEGYYTSTINVVGASGEPGKHKTTVEPITIYDPQGNDVTSQFNLTYSQGVLHIYQYQITLSTSSAQKVYDNQPLTFTATAEDCGYQITGDVLSAYDYVVELTGTRTDVGVSSNTAKITVKDKQTSEVITDIFLVKYQLGTLKVAYREIVIIAGSITKEYDGQPLTIDSDNYTVEGKLVEGHIIEAKAVGTLASFGTSYTKIEDVAIFDSKTGDDLTSQYKITCVEGELNMYLPE